MIPSASERRNAQRGTGSPRTPPDLLLIDGSHYLFRAYHALPALYNREGQPTGAIYGVVNMLRRLQADYRPARMAVVFDPRGKTFRNTLDANYKANRPPTPADLAEQISPLQDIIRAMGLPLLCVDGEEADDVIATLARQAARAGMRCLVATGDKDLAQLVDAHVHLLDSIKDVVLDASGVQRRFGVPPARIADYLALVGDAVDNIPGVPHVGPKTAARWLRTFGDLDAIMAAPDQIEGKAGERLRGCLEQLPLSRRLTTLRDRLNLPFGLEALETRAADPEELERQFRRLDFHSWLKNLREDAATATPPAEIRILRREAELAEWIGQLRGARLAALQVETAVAGDMHAPITGIGFATEDAAAYLPLGHVGVTESGAQLPKDAALQQLREVLEDAGLAKAGHGIKHGMNVLGLHGITLRGIACDSMLESYVFDSTGSGHALPVLCTRYLEAAAPTYEDTVGKGARRISFDRADVGEAAAYAAGSAAMVLRLHRHLASALDAREASRAVYRDIELPLIPVLSRMERNGVLIDPRRLAEQSRELERQLRELEAQAHALAGREFNLSSPPQLRRVLFDPDGLGLPIGTRTPKGEPSTAGSVLQKLAEGHELPRLLLRHRMLDKLRNTYVDKLPACIRPASGRVHTVYHQAVAVTGRLSSSDPNLQNIPIRTPEGKRIRQAFIAPPGHRLLTADYSQIELRIMAHLSADERLCAAFADGEDVHARTAAEILGIAPTQVDDAQRRTAKAINFGLIYGMSAYGLARQLDIKAECAQEYMDRYFERYAGVRDYMQQVRAQAHRQGYVETLHGRRLYLPELRSASGAGRQAAERAAINAPMQGTAADLIKRAMIDVQCWLDDDDCRARMVMQVHDELVFEVPEDQVEKVGARVRDIMEASGALDNVPLRVELGSGTDWDAAHAAH